MGICACAWEPMCAHMCVHAYVPLCMCVCVVLTHLCITFQLVYTCGQLVLITHILYNCLIFLGKQFLFLPLCPWVLPDLNVQFCSSKTWFINEKPCLSSVASMNPLLFSSFSWMGTNLLCCACCVMQFCFSWQHISVKGFWVWKLCIWARVLCLPGFVPW